MGFALSGPDVEAISSITLCIGSPGLTFNFELHNYFLTSSQFQASVARQTVFKCPAAQSPETLAVMHSDNSGYKNGTTDINYSATDKFNMKEIINERTDLITKKEGYEAMLYTIKAYWENSGSNDLTDILSGGEYWPGTDKPADSAFWEYWTEAIEKVRKDGPIFKIITK